MSFHQDNQMMGRFSNFTYKTQTHTAEQEMFLKVLGFRGKRDGGILDLLNFTEIPYMRLGKNLVKRYVQ